MIQRKRRDRGKGIAATINASGYRLRACQEKGPREGDLRIGSRKVYRAFELLSEGGKRFAGFEEAGQRFFEQQAGSVRKKIGDYVRDGVLDGNDVISDWFGQIQADVFISHSHADKELAVSLAGWLSQKMSLRPFVDSYVWGHADELLREIDKDHCWSDEREVYDYNARNRSTSHVHMMLSTALTQMIDNTECIIFLNTPQSFKNESLKLSRPTQLAAEQETSSPWIYAELVATQCLRTKLQRKVLTEDSVRKAEASLESLDVRYRARTAHLTPLDDQRVTRWEATGSRGIAALDALYEMFPRGR